MESIYNLTLDDLENSLISEGFPKYIAKQVFNWLYKKGVSDFLAINNISKDAREFLKRSFYFSGLDLIKKEKSSDGVLKFLFGLPDKNSIETVLIPDEKRNTLCVSTQVGCKFGCSFCASGENGFKRNLETSEIINQYLAFTKPNVISNIVFMGIGEPLDNFTNTIRAIKILMEPLGINFGKGKVCLSTCGLVSGIDKLSELNLDIKLSVSLHASDDTTRDNLVPINKKYPLKALKSSLEGFARVSKYPVTIEYVLIEGINAKKNDALGLAKFLGGFNSKLNLIPYNGSAKDYKAPSINTLREFKKTLDKKGIFFTLRKSRGQDIKAACGQLRASTI